MKKFSAEDILVGASVAMAASAIGYRFVLNPSLTETIGPTENNPKAFLAYDALALGSAAYFYHKGNKPLATGLAIAGLAGVLLIVQNLVKHQPTGALGALASSVSSILLPQAKK